MCKSWSCKRNNIYSPLDQPGELKTKEVILHFTLVPTHSDWAIQVFVFETHPVRASFPLHLHRYFKTALNLWAWLDYGIKRFSVKSQIALSTLWNKNLIKKQQRWKKVSLSVSCFLKEKGCDGAHILAKGIFFEVTALFCKSKAWWAAQGAEDRFYNKDSVTDGSGESGNGPLTWQTEIFLLLTFS